MHLNNKLENTLCYNCLNNTISGVEPLSEEYVSSNGPDMEKQLDILKTRLKYLQ